MNKLLRGQQIEAHRKKSCAGKIAYQSRRLALGRLKETIRIRKITGPMNVYRCVFCGLWHFGHVPAELLAQRARLTIVGDEPSPQRIADALDKVVDKKL